MACSSGCPTQDHASYGECLRSKSLQVQNEEAHRYNQSMNGALDDYVDARHSGMQPASVMKKDVAFAREMTDLTGTPFRADQ